MERKGKYSKGRQKITQPVTRVPPEALREPDPEFVREVDVAVKKLDKDRFVFRKTTGWLLAALILISLTAVTYAGTSIVTREHQFDHVREQVRELHKESAGCKEKHQQVEHRLVEIETQLENLQE